MSDPTQRTTTITGNKETGQILSIDRQVAEEAARIDFNTANVEEGRGSMDSSHRRNYEKPLLFPMAADATTYEALILAIGRSLRRKDYYEYDEKLGRNITKIYTHSSIAFCLEEVSSVFKKKTEDVMTFLQQGYDCGDYKKDTKTQGIDRIQKCCINLIGGTTPNTMRRLFGNNLLNEGYASRSIFLYEVKDRKTALFIPELNDTQRQYEKDILEHIKKLSQLYGQVTMSGETIEWLEDWWKRVQLQRVNVNEKLLDYYARKKIHAIKMGVAIHFSESTDMFIKLECFQRAIKMLDEVEKRMHHALITVTDNPYYSLGKKIIGYLTDPIVGAKSEKELAAKFWEQLPTNDPKEALRKTLEHYLVIGKIGCVVEKGISYYSVIKEKESSET
jgi:hypothetical protein